MIRFDGSFKVLVGLDPIDFRSGINRLSSIAQALFDESPKDRVIFVFRNKRKTDIKIIGYDTNGFFLGHKRLSKGKLSWWPRTEGECLSIDTAQLVKLLKGVDPRGDFHPDWIGLQDDGAQGRAYTDSYGSGNGRPQRTHQEAQAD
jgi:transposase